MRHEPSRRSFDDDDGSTEYGDSSSGDAQRRYANAATRQHQQLLRDPTKGRENKTAFVSTTHRTDPPPPVLNSEMAIFCTYWEMARCKAGATA